MNKMFLLKLQNPEKLNYNNTYLFPSLLNSLVSNELKESEQGTLLTERKVA
jgi:hypothetical protein